MKLYMAFYNLGQKHSEKVFVRADSIQEALQKITTEFPGAEVLSLSEENAELI